MMEHTKEPWPVFTDIAVLMTADPNGSPVAVLSWDDYVRARACVNACAGIPIDVLERVGLNWDRLEELKQQRDELLAAVPPLLYEAYDYGQFADDFDQPLAKPIRKAIRGMLDVMQTVKVKP